LDISYNQIHFIPSEISELAHLQELTACYNQLSEFSASFYKLSKQLYIIFDSVIDFILIISVFCLENLKKIDFSHNLFAEIPLEVGNLELLKEMGEWEIGISFLKQLQYLDLSYNQFKEWPDHVDKLEQLKELYLQYNELKELPMGIEQLKNLKLFHLEHNQMISLPMEFYELSLLEVIEVSFFSYSNFINLCFFQLFYLFFRSFTESITN
jgi:leucine-rich repeat protein SHOC2